MTTRITRDSTSNGTNSALVPALGETWAHPANMRIVLSWKNTRRCATITKSSYMPDASIFYKISVIYLYLLFHQIFLYYNDLIDQEIGFDESQLDDETNSVDNQVNNQMKKRKFDD